jgi:DNA-directed RNA polymerase sigma subunit (sigma70/sigma32)
MTMLSIPDTLQRPDVPLGRGVSLPHCEVIRRLQFLSGPERHVLLLRRCLAGPPRNVRQTAAILGLPPAQVRHLDELACAKLRHPSTGAATQG